MKKVVIAIDYNPVSEKVVGAGFDFVKHLNAEIILLHVLDDAGYYQTQFPTFLGYDGYSGMAPDLNWPLEMRKIAEEFMEKAKAQLNYPNVHTSIVEGDTATGILEFCNQYNADLLVMGTHSHSVLEKLLMGTVAEKILEKTKIPVFMVPVKEE